MRKRLSMGNSAAAALAWLASFAGYAAQLPAPPPGHRILAVSTMASRPCVSIQGVGARILLSENELRELSLRHGQPYASEDERLARIAGDRAALLLGALSDGRDASGCRWSSVAGPGPNHDAVYLVGDLIENGHAMVIRDGASRPEVQVVVRDANGAGSGFRYFELLDGTAFFSFMTWIT